MKEYSLMSFFLWLIYLLKVIFILEVSDIIRDKVQMVPNNAQFDDRIRNLLALAEDNSTESRTLLFSHICDLFLQERPMESDNQKRMLIEIINELISDVDVSIRIELRQILLNMDHPPGELTKLISEDDIQVSGKLLEDA